jgi:DNA-binding transcriptional LysR family regulator
LTIDLTNRLVDPVSEGYDLAIRTGKPSDARLIATRVASRTLYACAAPSYLARAGEPASVDDLAAHECIIGTSPLWQFADDGRELLHRPKGRFRCNSGPISISCPIFNMAWCN